MLTELPKSDGSIVIIDYKPKEVYTIIPPGYHQGPSFTTYDGEVIECATGK